jgi:hypothetical protein
MRKIYLATALIVGTLDITYAIVFSYFRSGTSPERLLQSVAAGWFGRDAAFSGGAPTAAAGLAFHYFIAFTITALFFAAASRLPGLVSRPALVGPLYGIGVYVVMNWVVIPLSRIAVFPRPAPVVLISGLLVHMFLIGLPIALGARRALFGSTAEGGRPIARVQGA